jgi:CHAT domain-containing protein/tetratricopeptide (TPR) repeat protein
MVDPRRAHALATDALAEARAAGSAHGQVVAYRALGLAAHGLHDAATAAAHLRHAIRLAQRHRLAVAEAEARMSYSLILDDLGRPAAALREIDLACTRLRGLRLARAITQRALILRRLGREEEALASYRRAIALFRRHDDLPWLGRALTNRGVLHGYRGDLRQARSDLEAAHELFTRLDIPDFLARVRHNIGFLAAQAGDVPTALSWYDRAHEHLRRTGISAIGLIDRAELLISARLLPEARATLDEAIEACRRGQLRSLLGQAQLLSARVDLLGDAPNRARERARLAARTFDRQGRGTLAAYARRVAAAARIADATADRRVLTALELAGDELSASWLPQAWDAWIDAAHLALSLGDPVAAARNLTKADAARRSGPAPLRARAWHARALLHLEAGRVDAAKRAAAIGFREIEQHGASLGSTDLGVRSAADGVPIAALRLRLALRDGKLREALRWLQRSRSAALRLPPARPSSDPVIEARLAELRRIAGELAATPLDPNRTRRLLRRQRAAEAEVRARAWQAHGGDPGSPGRQPSAAALCAALDGRALVELFRLDGMLHALVVVDGKVRHRVLCRADDASAELAALRFAMRRQVLRGTSAHHGSAAARAGDREAVEYSRTQLDGMLLAPVAGLIGDRPLVLTPTGSLHALAWPLLATCRGRPLCVAPSSWLWWQAANRAPATGGAVLIAGPRPPQAAAEVDALHALRPDATALTAERATVAAALGALDGAGSAHIATHGEFRADNPLFSYLQLVDGPLTVYDLSALRAPPPLLILSACDTGLSAVHPGDELQGLSAALLGLGARSVVASLGPVDDEATRQLMVGFHGRLRTGIGAAAALAGAQGALDPAYDSTAASFVCLGTG